MHIDTLKENIANFISDDDAPVVVYAAMHRNYKRPFRWTGQQIYRIANWPAYNAGLKARGHLGFWIAPEVLAGWGRRVFRAGQNDRRRSDEIGSRHFPFASIL